MGPGLAAEKRAGTEIWTVMTLIQMKPFEVSQKKKKSQKITGFSDISIWAEVVDLPTKISNDIAKNAGHTVGLKQLII